MKRTLSNLYKSIKETFDQPFVKNTLGTEYRVYLYLGKEDGFNQFLDCARAEGITFGDNKDLSEKPYTDVLALNENMTVNYVGTWGHTAFNHPESSSRFIFRIDLKKYLSGDEEYMYMPTAV